jgi:hypothetical protein
VVSDTSNAKSRSVAGAVVPDSKLSREVTELVRDTEPPLLFHHSSRVYYWGALTGKRRGLRFDPELLYAGAMFHDIGLTPKHASAHERFENKAEFLDPAQRHTWRHWKYNWLTPEKPSKYTLLARAKDATGNVQPNQHDPNHGTYVIDHSLPIEVIVADPAGGTARGDDNRWPIAGMSPR